MPGIWSDGWLVNAALAVLYRCFCRSTAIPDLIAAAVLGHLLANLELARFVNNLPPATAAIPLWQLVRMLLAYPCCGGIELRPTICGELGLRFPKAGDGPACWPIH